MKKAAPPEPDEGPKADSQNKIGVNRMKKAARHPEPDEGPKVESKNKTKIYTMKKAAPSQKLLFSACLLLNKLFIHL